LRGSGSGGGGTRFAAPAAWAAGAVLRAEVEVRAPGALGSGAAGGLRARLPPVVWKKKTSKL
jgi:hypothetical protein